MAIVGYGLCGGRIAVRPDPHVEHAIARGAMNEMKLPSGETRACVSWGLPNKAMREITAVPTTASAAFCVCVCEKANEGSIRASAKALTTRFSCCSREEIHRRDAARSTLQGRFVVALHVFRMAVAARIALRFTAAIASDFCFSSAARSASSC